MAFFVLLVPLRLISASFCARPSFAPAVHFSAGPFSMAVVVGDFNNDSKPDLAVANQGDNPARTNGSVSILLGKGDGTFQAVANHELRTNVVKSVVAGDFNRDTNLDLAVLTFTPDRSADSIVLILLGNGDGQFTQGATYPVDLYGRTLAVGDLNGDGNPELRLGSQNEHTATAAEHLNCG